MSSSFKSDLTPKYNLKKQFTVSQSALVRYNNSSIYSGSVYNNLKIGIGYMKFDCGSIYIGEFLKDTYNGLGYFKVSTSHKDYEQINRVMQSTEFELKNSQVFERSKQKMDLDDSNISEEDNFNYTDDLQFAVYLGEFEEGLRHGVGKFKNKCIEYVGQFLQGEFTGLAEVLELDTGDLHKGSFVCGEKNGFGVLVTNPLSKTQYSYEYYGGYMKGLKHGLGVEKINSSIIYVGNFRNNVKDGIGVILDIKNGKKVIFEGFWSNGQKTGYCKDYTDSRKEYEGMVIQGIKHGLGRLKFYDQNRLISTFFGQFEQDLQNGIGHLETDSYIYIGEFLRGKKHGKGYMKYKPGSNLDSYFGQFSENYQTGYGIQRDKEGYQFEGQFVQNKKHGYFMVTNYTFLNKIEYIHY